MVALLVFILAYRQKKLLDRRSLFWGNIFKMQLDDSDQNASQHVVIRKLWHSLDPYRHATLKKGSFIYMGNKVIISTL